MSKLLKAKQVSDPVSISRIEKLHPMIVNTVKEMYKEICEKLESNGIRVRISQGLRTFKEQDDLYSQGRTKPGKIVTNAKAGQSPHNYGLAFDIVIQYDVDGNGTFETLSWDTKKDIDKNKQSDWMEVVYICKKHGFVWGGDWTKFKDMPHFEWPGYGWKYLLKKYNNNEFIKSDYVKL